MTGAVVNNLSRQEEVWKETKMNLSAVKGSFR